MNPTRFDTLTKALGQARTRRTVLRALGGAVSASGLALVGRAAGAWAAPGGNSACDAFCHAVFGETREAGQCTRDAAHGTGLCPDCGADPRNYDPATNSCISCAAGQQACTYAPCASNSATPVEPGTVCCAAGETCQGDNAGHGFCTCAGESCPTDFTCYQGACIPSVCGV